MGLLRKGAADLFLLPYIPVARGPCSRSRRVGGRVSRAIYFASLSNEVTRTLDTLSGCPNEGHVCRTGSISDQDYNPEHVEILNRILSRVKSRAMCCRESFRDAATGGDLCAALKLAGFKMDCIDNNLNKYSPFAEPPLNSPCIKIQEVLPPGFFSSIFEGSRMFLPSLGSASANLRQQDKLYDGVLGGGKYDTLGYFRRGLAAWRTSVRRLVCCKLAAVPKKFGEQLRKILMVCPLNNLCVEAEDVGDAFSHIGLCGPAPSSRPILPLTLWPPHSWMSPTLSLLWSCLRSCGRSRWVPA